LNPGFIITSALAPEKFCIGSTGTPAAASAAGPAGCA
jgi:hypothetical protein